MTNLETCKPNLDLSWLPVRVSKDPFRRKHHRRANESSFSQRYECIITALMSVLRRCRCSVNRYRLNLYSEEDSRGWYIDV